MPTPIPSPNFFFPQISTSKLGFTLAPSNHSQVFFAMLAGFLNSCSGVTGPATLITPT